MMVRYRVLVENRIDAPGTVAEHGLSLWIETPAARILFDTGQSGVVRENAAALGIDLATAEHLVLSHGHYDHTGGLAAVDALLPDALPIHAHPEVFAPHCKRNPDGTAKVIGMPAAGRAMLERRRASLRSVVTPTMIAPGIWLTGSIPRDTDYEDPGGDFRLGTDLARPDPIADDMALWIDAPEGLWIFLGCAHAGAVNTIRHIQAVAGRERVHGIIGGAHLHSASPERLERTAAFLRALAPEVLDLNHCTGDRIRPYLAD